MALIKEYFTLTDKYTAEYGQNTVVLLQVGAFFEVYALKDDYDNIPKLKYEKQQLLEKINNK